MGHRKLGGFLREVELAGAPFLRIDVPEADPRGPVTQFYAPGAIYAITPTTEDTARALARSARPAPVDRYELLPPPPSMSPEERAMREALDRIGRRIDELETALGDEGLEIGGEG